MKFLITGTAGFIGFSLAKRLLDEGNTVIGVDNLNDYYSVAYKNMRHTVLKEYDSFIECKIDLCDLESLKKIFVEHNPTIVCNLAAQAGVRYSLINPYAYQKSNIEGFLNVLDLSHRHGVKRFVYASSSSVYAGVKQMPLVEDQRLDTPISLYAATKKSNELMAHSYSDMYKLQTVGLRFFSVYGPWGRPDMAMWLFAEAILEGNPINVFNYGDMKRDFTYIDDIIFGVKASLLNEDLPLYSIFNLGNNKMEQISDMIQMLEKELGGEAKQNPMPMQAGDIPESHADVTLAGKVLGFKPTTPISAGIPKFVKWYLSKRDEIKSLKC